MQFRSRRVRARVDLTPLASRLNDAEADTAPGADQGALWKAEPVSALTPTLAPAGDAPSNLTPAAVRSLLEEHLRTADPAWDPYTPSR